MKLRKRFIRRLFGRTKRNLVLSIFGAVVCSVIFWGDILETFEPEANISCHQSRSHSNNSFPVLEKHSNLPSRSIFFHATCPDSLTSRKYCSIESAARTNADWQVNVLFSIPTSFDKNPLEEFHNVKYWTVRLEELLKGSFLEDYINSGVKKCRWKRWSAELSRDVLKYLTLDTWGGIYLDFDMVVARPFGTLVRNWATRYDDDTIAEDVMALTRDAVGGNVSEIAVKEIQWILRRGNCNSKKPSILTNVLKIFCSTPDAASMSSATCNGFEVYGPRFFHPISENHARDYFIPGELIGRTNDAYTYHLWDSVTKEYSVARTSPFAKLARRYCPLTFKLYPHQFGF